MTWGRGLKKTPPTQIAAVFENSPAEFFEKTVYIFGGDDMADIGGSGAPSKYTAGAIGDIYTDSITGAQYELVNIYTSRTYTGVEITYEWYEFAPQISGDGSIVVDNVVTAGSNNPVSSRAVITYVNTNVTTIVEEKIETQLQDKIDESVNQAVADAMGGSSDDDAEVADEIDSWF